MHHLGSYRIELVWKTSTSELSSVPPPAKHPAPLEKGAAEAEITSPVGLASDKGVRS